MKDYYKILGINNDADYQTIKSAYRNLIKKYHPDVNKSEDASEKFIEIHEAFSILRDKVKRDAFDQVYHRYYNNDDVNSVNQEDIDEDFEEWINDDVNSVNQEDIDEDFEEWISDSLKQAKDLMKQPLTKKVETAFGLFSNVVITFIGLWMFFIGFAALPLGILVTLIGYLILSSMYDKFQESKTLYDFLTELDD